MNKMRLIKSRSRFKTSFAVLSALYVFIQLIFYLKSSLATPVVDNRQFPNQNIRQFQETEIVARRPYELPSLYEYYTIGGIRSGLSPGSTGFELNNKPFKIISGAIHYFRVHPAYWRDRLRKARAAGLTAIETYVPWNLHESRRDNFDFGQGGTDWSPFLDLVSFLRIAQSEDLFVVIRPGPYICSEWDFGGLPSWLLRDPTMHVRTSYAPYLERVDKYFERLIPLLAKFQFSDGNGPIIAVQVENEYGAFGYGDLPRDRRYLEHLCDKMKSLGLKEMFLTSDSPLATLDWGAVAGALQTANLQSNVAAEFKALLELQPDKPLMVTEFWAGWFDHWTEQHHTLPTTKFNNTLKAILNYGASVNFYMFHGGTNFGFMNGANAVDEFPFYVPDVTSYDYDAPLSESGDYTPKYEAINHLIGSYLPVKTRLPLPPPESAKTAYPTIAVEAYHTFDDLINQLPEDKKVTSKHLMSMEELPINDMNGQSYGFIIYRKILDLSPGSRLKIRGHIRDFAYVLVDGQLHSKPVTSLGQLRRAFGSWLNRDQVFAFDLTEAVRGAVLDIVVENTGRVNYGKPHNFVQKKGLWEGPLLLDGLVLENWNMMALEFEGPWVRNLKRWRTVTKDAALSGPIAVRGTLQVEGNPQDTFMDMSSWGKGVVFINGFNIGRYWCTGPQQTLYVPAPLLRTGQNSVIIFELYQTNPVISFTDKAILGTPS